MRWDLDKVAAPIACKLLAATVMPRPIAWAVTQSPNGTLNAAPYSFFNVMGSAPPTTVLGLMADPKARLPIYDDEHPRHRGISGQPDIRIPRAADEHHLG